MSQKVAIVKCNSYIPQQYLYEKIKYAIDLLGGMKKFVFPKEKILIKPNLLSAHKPDEAVTTHPEFVRAVIRLVKEQNAIPVIGDSPWSSQDIENIWSVTGMKKICTDEKVNLVNFATAGLKEIPIKDIPAVEKIYISKVVDNVDGIISLPKLKTHNLTILTCAIKNLYGFIPGILKTEYHKIVPDAFSFSKLLRELLRHIKPRLTIVDSIIGMDGDGPVRGRIRDFGIVISGEDPIAIDTAIFRMMGLSAEKIPMISVMRDIIKDSNIVLLGDTEVVINNVKLPKTHFTVYIPKPMTTFASKFVSYWPKIDTAKCRLCLKCISACPVNAIARQENELRIVYKYCIKCCCCIEACKYGAIRVTLSPLAKLLQIIPH